MVPGIAHLIPSRRADHSVALKLNFLSIFIRPIAADEARKIHLC